MLTLAHISKVYGARVILKQLNAHITPGVTLLLGSNGAGKSTLLRIMAGLSRPTSGAVESTVDAVRMGYVGHATFVYPGLTAWENLDFWRQAYGRSRAEVNIDAALDRVALRAYAYERAGTFSRGMAQRLSLARVFMLTPDILLLDEPATGLDAPSAAVLRAEVDNARRRGAAIVWISHQLEADLPMADRVWALHKGRLTYDGPARDFSATPLKTGGAGEAAEGTCCD